MAPVLEVKNLQHIYSVGTPFEHVALEDVSFSVERGEFIGIIGHTGSGKSTLIQHLNGLLKPTEGRVLFESEDIWSSKSKTHGVRFKVGLVFQYPEYQLFEETVYKDIAFGPKNMKLSGEEIDARVREAAGFVGIGEELLEKSPFELSGGQKRRVAIAGVIAMRPDVLILDEPTAGLDPAGSEEILSNIREYHSRAGSTVLFVTHSMEDAARVADRLIVFSKGQIVMSGAPEQIFARADELTEIDLSVPEITKVVARLREMGLNIPASIYTVEQAKAALMKLKEGGNA